jgi:phosphatidylethanolamine/phosphatidyl-N-methylethanolamine N-methyltransferase
MRGLAAMDACRLGLPDASFDAVTVPFVITLVRTRRARSTSCGAC